MRACNKPAILSAQHAAAAQRTISRCNAAKHLLPLPRQRIYREQCARLPMIIAQRCTRNGSMKMAKIENGGE